MSRGRPLSTLAAFAWTAGAWAQPGIGPAPEFAGLAPLSEVAVLEIPRTASVESRSAAGPEDPDGPFEFADPFAVAAGPSSHGRWEVTTDGETAVWRLRVSSEGSVSLNFGFARYRMPAGARLRIHTPDGSEVVGPYTDADNEDHGELWTPVLPGDEAVIEVAVPVGRLGEVELEIGSVNRGFRDVGFRIGGPPSSCNIDVACGQGDPYRDQIRGVGFMQYGGSRSCSGVLLNNTAEDGRPYFLTARHCGFGGDQDANARSVVVYWNYENPGCGSGSGSHSQSQSGALFRTDHVVADLALIELDDDLDPAHELFLAGWDRSGSTVGFPVSIHHPRSGVKSITTYSEPAVPVTGRERIEAPDGEYFLTEWPSGGGIIEPGSSGSPLFDDVGRVVGGASTINYGAGCHGGEMSAGRVARAWGRLGPWLDPTSTGAMSLDGREAGRGPLSLRALDDKAVKAPGAGESAEPLPVDLGPFFWHSGAMAWAASSSDESAVTVSVSGSSVSLTPVAAGSSTITVTATDAVDSSRSATGTFVVTVGSNRSPEPSGTLADRTFNEGDTAQVALASAFTDGDGDSLTYAASSTDTSAATVALSGSTVTVTAVNGPGTATIDVTATDASGSNTRARRRFEVAVLNQPPQAVGSLPDVPLQVGDGNEVVNVSAAFTDPEGEALTYRVRSSDRSVARSTFSGSKITLIPVARGNATFTVWAREVGGSYASATQTIDVRVMAARGVSVSASALTVWEGSTATYTVALNSEPTGAVTIAPSVASGSGVTVTPSSLAFDASNWETAQTVTVSATQDADLAEESATIGHAVSGADYGSVGAAPLDVAVLDDEAPVLSVVPASAGESAGSMTFDVTLSFGIAEQATVDWATSDGSGVGGALAGKDYAAASGTLTFQAGTTARQVVVGVFDDSHDEEELETLLVTLRNPRNVTLHGGVLTLQAMGFIEDDDLPEVRAYWHVPSDPESFLADEKGTLTPRPSVWLDKRPEREVRIAVELTNRNGASRGVDYYYLTPIEGRRWSLASHDPAVLVFQPDWQELMTSLRALDDDLDDDCESVTLRLVPRTTERVTVGGPLTITIVDDDGEAVDCDRNSGGADPGGGGGGGTPPPPEPEPDPDPEPPPPPPAVPPTAAFEVEGAACDADLCRALTGETLRFADTSGGTVRFRRWEFGDGDTSRAASPVHAWSSPGFHEVTLEVSDGASPSTARRTFLVEAAAPKGSCVADAETLCLQDSRYAVSVEWSSGGGETGAGRVVHRGTNDSGLFRFFDAENWEVLIKVLDGCSANGHVWVFGGSTTDLGYVIRVTDTATGAVKEYGNEPGTPAAAITDATAFPGGCRS